MIPISLIFVPGDPIDMSALVQVMACRLFGAKSLPEPMLLSSLTYIWATRGRRVGE